MADSRVIPGQSLWYVYAAMAAVMLPHLLRMPVWVVIPVGLCMLWRQRIQSTQRRLPGRLLRSLLVVAVVSTVLLTMGGAGNSVEVSVALLLLGAALKLLEMRSVEDASRICALLFLLMATQFLFSQDIPLAVFSLLQVILLLAAMNATVRPSGSGEPRAALRFLMQSLPLMLILFVLVPRIAPLWSMPAPGGGGASSGISDEMSPGDITRLGRSTELAFRAGFEDAVPAPESLYWRGLVLDAFDGRTWRRGDGSPSRRDSVGSRTYSNLSTPGEGAERFEYQLIMEPTGENWLYALSPVTESGSGVWMHRDFTLYTERRISQRMRYSLQSVSAGNYAISSSLMSEQALQLPDSGNARSRALAEQLRASSDDDVAYAESVLRHFNEQEFHYTLSPPAMGADSIDAFLFDSREGFCGHYAGAFTYLMRAAGIPARVVVGYQGGEINPYEEYLMVHQYNAHAWAEIWLEEQGWVRVDPTMAVAPERISLGAEAWLEQQEGTPGFDGQLLQRYRNLALINALRLRMDSINYTWSQRVINYDGQQQLDLLSALTGLRSMSALFNTLLIVVGMTLLLMAAWALYGGNVVREGMPRERVLYQRFLRIAARTACVRQPGEGPQAYALRLAEQRPDLREAVSGLTACFVLLRYGKPVSAPERRRVLQQMKGYLKQFRTGLGFNPRRAYNGNPVSQARP